ncbi:FdhF/YdeP family oxidoreductase [Nocardia camponoti]|uniref:Formate dehydrogenase subunit alpha n=1 Tax=Nocardia camponoti TaxID=1616106 RepID=A0A917QCN2_9NOCA|nr:FdhF/YdeP family oxidoreductase [Nocardia camponoti]GGK43779.1 formate dehydrogenase subunit alpha [Nocardia camponoti]
MTEASEAPFTKWDPDNGPSAEADREAVPKAKPYKHPAAGWGAAIAVGKFMILKEHEPFIGTYGMFKMNQYQGGFDCPGCAWPDARDGLILDVCENGIKHTTWEMTHNRTTPEFFAEHTVSELATWSDYDLENQGRLTHPMVYDAKTDHYVPISWQDAFEMAGKAIRELPDPNLASYYTSGRLANEATFLYQLMIRETGTNNMPDCSNMCHEASGRGLQASLGTGKGTCDLDDWDQSDALFIMGLNAASNTPRMLTALAKAYKRGAQIVHINPFIEAGARDTIIPHDIPSMVLFQTTPTSTLNLQVRVGGDFALIRGMAKATLEECDTNPKVINHEFINRYTVGFDDWMAEVKGTTWADIQKQSGLSETEIRKAAQIYCDAKSSIISWCLGVTQHEHGVETIREIVNLLLCRGNLGREGAGPSPVRGHSNVQGNRTCGIDNHPPKAWIDRLNEVCKINAPYEDGLDVVGTIEAMQAGKIKVFMSMGGNFVQAAPDSAYTYEAFQKCDMTIIVSTKLNRSHVIHGKQALILPCIGRTEHDHQRSGQQVISMENGMAVVHLSKGMKKPASRHLKSEPAILAGIAKQALPNTKTPWEWYVEDYDRIRDTMSKVLEGFEDYNRRVRLPLGFRIRQPARELIFLTPSGKAEFSSVRMPDTLPPEGKFSLFTTRSQDQWNTTIYTDNDRYRGIKNLRTLIFMNKHDMKDLGLKEFDEVDITSYARDGSTRQLLKYKVIQYNMPRGCTAGYMPEMNVLCAIGDYSTESRQPLMKSVKVTVVPSKN